MSYNELCDLLDSLTETQIGQIADRACHCGGEGLMTVNGYETYCDCLDISKLEDE